MKLKNSFFYTLRENVKDEDSVSSAIKPRGPRTIPKRQGHARRSIENESICGRGHTPRLQATGS